MSTSTRVVLTTGFAALSLAALTVTTAIPPMAMQTIQVARPATFTPEVVADASGTPAEPAPSEDDLDSALALIEQLTTVADGRVVTVRLDGGEDPGYVSIAPAEPNAQGGSAGGIGQGALDGPEAQNAASDLIDSVYSVTRYWANYVSTELGPSLINWLPFGYLISDQILIWYPDFVLPTVDSFVYDFLDPVVNDPLNLTVWVEGIGDIINTAATGISEGISNEINYILTLGWFPFPLPPLPDVPLAGPAPVSVAGPTAAELPTSADTSSTIVAPETPIGPADKVADEPTAEPAEGEAATENGAEDEIVTEDESVAETVAEDEVTAEDEVAAEDVEKAAGENSGTPAEDSDEFAPEADESTLDTDESDLDVDESALDTDEPGLGTHEADSTDESGADDQPGDDADSGETSQQDSAPGAGEDSGDDAGGAPDASTSDGS